MMERLFVETPDPDTALSLVDELRNLHSELLPGEGGRCEVQVELGESRELQIDGALAAVERWLTATGIETAKLTLNDRTYILERRAEPPRDAQMNGGSAFGGTKVLS